MELLLIRHGKAETNGKIAGHKDFPLSSEGIEESIRLAKQLLGFNITHLYSSPLSRALVTSTIIGDTLGINPIILEELKERNAGVFNGLSKEEAMKKYPNQWQQSWSNPLSAPPEGESFQDVVKRIEKLISNLMEQTTDETIAFVSHSGCINIILLMLIGINKELFPLFKLDTASVTSISINKGKTPFINYINRISLFK
ncbi:histidine phosphatase family protein [Neobacillus sp. YIM B06451]|uniref:histidine phosphatase family protein n=1 Tax=Neobacillus sp. YIM B06451 TaxID=3070994 RepID=UPI00292FE7D1|nr:histidine phosphatase family protein [Neobacillus sp. YIM B06451]